MPIARDDVAHLARLSRMDLAEAELDHLAAQLDVIISAVARVQEVAVEGVPPTSHAVPLVNVFRDDVEWPCLSAEGGWIVSRQFGRGETGESPRRRRDRGRHA